MKQGSPRRSHLGGSSSLAVCTDESFRLNLCSGGWHPSALCHLNGRTQAR